MGLYWDHGKEMETTIIGLKNPALLFSTFAWTTIVAPFATRHPRLSQHESREGLRGGQHRRAKRSIVRMTP